MISGNLHHWAERLGEAEILSPQHSRTQRLLLPNDQHVGSFQRFLHADINGDTFVTCSATDPTNSYHAQIMLSGKRKTNSAIPAPEPTPALSAKGMLVAVEHVSWPNI